MEHQTQKGIGQISDQVQYSIGEERSYLKSQASKLKEQIKHCKPKKERQKLEEKLKKIQEQI